METWETHKWEVGVGVGGGVNSWWESSSSRRRRRRNVRHESERERKTAACALFIADICWLGVWRRRVCAQLQWGSVRYREVFVLKCEKRPLLETLSSQGHWRRRGLAPFLVKVLYQGCVGCISPHHQPYTERLDLQKMMEFTIMSC